MFNKLTWLKYLLQAGDDVSMFLAEATALVKEDVVELSWHHIRKTQAPARGVDHMK